LVITVIIHVMDVYLNYVTVLMEYVISKTYAKQDWTVLSVTKVHIVYYIYIVEKMGNVLINLKKKKSKKTPLSQVKHVIRISTLQIHIYMITHSYDLDTSKKSKEFF
jgi:hypothetical protein